MAYRWEAKDTRPKPEHRGALFANVTDRRSKADVWYTLGLLLPLLSFTLFVLSLAVPWDIPRGEIFLTGPLLGIFSTLEGTRSARTRGERGVWLALPLFGFNLLALWGWRLMCFGPEIQCW